MLLCLSETPQDSAIIVAAAAISDQSMLSAIIGVQKSAIRYSTLIRQIVRIGTATGVV